MHAFAIFQDDHTVTDVELPTPTPEGTEILLRVVRSGVCHTDMHLREGYYDLGSRGRLNLIDRGVTYPLVLGHEVVGVVEAAGPDADGVSPGEHRLVYPWIGDGSCDACQAGHENLCPSPRNLGVARHGGYAEFILVPHPRYLLDVTGIEERWAATLACSGLTAYSAARKALPATASDPVVVIGAGGVGLMAIATLRALGHEAVLAVDLQERNLELARQLGATTTISARQEDLAAAIVAGAGGPVAAIVDFVNNSTTAPAAFAALRKGGTMVQVGLFGGELVIPTALLTLKIGLPAPTAQARMSPLDLVSGAREIVGSYLGSAVPSRDIPYYETLWRTGKLPLEKLISTHIPLSEVNAGFDALARGEAIRQIIQFPGACA